MVVLPARQAAHCTQLKGSAPWRAASAVTLCSIGMLSKLFLYSFHKVATPGRPEFLRLLQNRKRPIITVSNHISIVDDPLLWGLMPFSTLARPHNVRWSLGSADICFTNKVSSTFFSLGQTLATYRHGVGIFQQSLDDAIQLLARENIWLHVFPEGRIRQSKDLSMRYFKWGISRIILETTAVTGEQPIIVPMFIEGFDKIMHESRSFPRFLPRIGKSVRCTYGAPIEESLVAPFVERWTSLARASGEAGLEDAEWVDGREAQAIRRDLTKVVRDAVVRLREEAGYAPEHPEAHRAEFYDSAEGLKYDELSGIPRPEIFRKKAPPPSSGKKVYEKEGPI